ncbi:hypothetical protein GS489_05450 [Rhodococcus hoagii]|nr:hypothetical protein [Prescottella equi]
MSVRELSHFIGGKRIPGTSGRFADVFDPNTGQVQARGGGVARRHPRCTCPVLGSKTSANLPDVPGIRLPPMK